MAGFPRTEDINSLRATEIQRNKLRRKYINDLASVLTASRVAFHKKRHNDNKPCYMLLFKFNPDKKDQQMLKDYRNTLTTR